MDALDLHKFETLYVSDYSPAILLQEMQAVFLSTFLCCMQAVHTSMFTLLVCIFLSMCPQRQRPMCSHVFCDECGPVSCFMRHAQPLLLSRLCHAPAHTHIPAPRALLSAIRQLTLTLCTWCRSGSPRLTCVVRYNIPLPTLQAHPLPSPALSSSLLLPARPHPPSLLPAAPLAVDLPQQLQGISSRFRQAAAAAAAAAVVLSSNHPRLSPPFSVYRRLRIRMRCALMSGSMRFFCAHGLAQHMFHLEHLDLGQVSVCLKESYDALQRSI